MRKCWLIVIIVFAAVSVNAQNNFFFGHYMFNPSYFNPGWTGGVDKAFVTFQHRSQWLGYTSSFDGAGGSPTTQMITGIVPIQNFPLSSVGLIISNDNLGPVANLQVQLPLSYSRDIQAGKISIGVAPSMFSQTIQFDKYRPNEPDPLIPAAGSQTAISPDLSAGVFFKANNGLYVGASALNILQPSFDFGVEQLENIQEISYTLHAGNQFTIASELVIQPNILIRSDLNGFTFDFGAIATLREKIWGGISYRRQESAIIYLGYSLLTDDRLKIGYSFDYVFQNQDGKAPTSHEIFIKYDLPDLVFGGRKAVKTPRFSY